MVKLGFPGLAWHVTDKVVPSNMFCLDSKLTKGGSVMKMLELHDKLLLIRFIYSFKTASAR